MLDEAQQVLSQARCVFTEKEVDAALSVMAKKITEQMQQENPVVLCVMNGGLVVTGKLLPQLEFALQLDYIHATRYRNELTGNELQWKSYPTIDLKDRTVLIVDDILDEGETLARIRDYCVSQGATQVKTAVLVDKNHDRRTPDLKRADFTSLDAPDSYLFGCGMDYKTYLRNVPGIYAVAGT